MTITGGPTGGPTFNVTLVTHQALLGHALSAALEAGETPVDLLVVDPDGFDGRSMPSDVVLVEVDVAYCDTVAMLRRVRHLAPHAVVVVLAPTATLPAVTAAVEEGARGYVTLDATPADVAAAVATVAQGGIALPPVTAVARTTLDSSGPGCDALSPRERDILCRLARGDSTARIAEETGTTVNTTRTHIRNILGKLGVHSRVQAAAYADRMGLRAVSPAASAGTR